MGKICASSLPLGFRIRGVEAVGFDVGDELGDLVGLRVDLFTLRCELIVEDLERRHELRGDVEIGRGLSGHLGRERELGHAFHAGHGQFADLALGEK